MRTECGVVVAIPEAEPVVARFRDQFDPPAVWGVPAHVTVLYPFVSPADIDETVRADLARAVGDLQGVEEEITRRLPVHADIHEVRLMCGNRAPGTWYSVETFALRQ